MKSLDAASQLNAAAAPDSAGMNENAGISTDSYDFQLLWVIEYARPSVSKSLCLDSTQNWKNNIAPDCLSNTVAKPSTLKTLSASRAT